MTFISKSILTLKFLNLKPLKYAHKNYAPWDKSPTSPLDPALIGGGLKPILHRRKYIKWPAVLMNIATALVMTIGLLIYAYLNLNP